MSATSATDAGRARTTRDLLSRIETLVATAWFSYGLVLVLQLRVIWNVWRYKDLTPGDSAHYFLDAAGWAHGLHDNIVWSPLYTDTWGTVLALVKDHAYVSETIMRIGVVLAATVLVLALMRRLLSPAIGLVIATWWAIVAANYDVLYEVHLFGLLPVLVACYIVARDPGRSSIGIAAAILAGSALLLRNELVIATAILITAIVIRELKERRARRVSAAIITRAYVLPLCAVSALAGGVYLRSYVQGSALGPWISEKQGLNMCQAYAFNFQQRHPDRFRGNAFTECAPLMQQTFGRPWPSLIEATMDNPRAVAGFVKWNLQLLPSGVQVALFNATSSGMQPDYAPVERREVYALVLSVLVLTLIVGGALAIRRDYAFWRHEWVPPRRWALLVLGAVAVTTCFVVLTQRPRPEYMYGLSVGLLGLAGVCASALLRRVRWTRVVPTASALVVLVLIATIPSHYPRAERPLHDAVQRLRVIRRSLQQRSSVLVASQFGFETCAYLAGSYNRSCAGADWGALQSQLARGISVRTALDSARATAIYAEGVLLANASIAGLVAEPKRYGWRQIAAGRSASGPWHVLVRAS